MQIMPMTWPTGISPPSSRKMFLLKQQMRKGDPKQGGASQGGRPQRRGNVTHHQEIQVSIKGA
jgi:hypothetical protein